jgi:hypothetical protein
LELLRDWDSDLDLDELESIIANLIFQGLIKGHIIHDKRYFVLQIKVEAFPLKGT